MTAEQPHHQQDAVAGEHGEHQRAARHQAPNAGPQTRPRAQSTWPLARPRRPGATTHTGAATGSAARTPATPAATSRIPTSHARSQRVGVEGHQRREQRDADGDPDRDVPDHEGTGRPLPAGPETAQRHGAHLGRDHGQHHRHHHQRPVRPRRPPMTGGRPRLPGHRHGLWLSVLTRTHRADVDISVEVEPGERRHGVHPPLGVPREHAAVATASYLRVIAGGREGGHLSAGHDRDAAGPHVGSGLQVALTLSAPLGAVGECVLKLTSTRSSSQQTCGGQPVAQRGDVEGRGQASRRRGCRRSARTPRARTSRPSRRAAPGGRRGPPPRAR